jgi:hypothetical protein
MSSRGAVHPKNIRRPRSREAFSFCRHEETRVLYFLVPICALFHSALWSRHPARPFTRQVDGGASSAFHLLLF